jgi:hypothetical protein
MFSAIKVHLYLSIGLIVNIQISILGNNFTKGGDSRVIMLVVFQLGGIPSSSTGRMIGGAGVTSDLNIASNAASKFCAMTIRFS